MTDKYKAFIFDLDGVLIDSESLRIRTYVDLFRSELNTEITIKKNELIGNSEEKNLRSIIDEYSLDTDIDFLINKRKSLLEAIAKKAKFNHPILNLVILANKMGLATAVCTNSHKDYLEVVLGRLPSEARINVALSSNDIVKPKPDPEIYINASSKLGIQPEKCLVFEDSKPGVEAAKRANMDVIIIPEDVASTLITIDEYSGA